ncbi:hypothetical protein Q1695_003641 [Nippostrongylus brasiliensis]|nr:hypothetical protein Q1695_003641 [Nippostrongylus brasiliensis]
MAIYEKQWNFTVVYSDFDIGLHRSVKDCALGVLKRQEGQLNEEVVRTITTKIKEMTNASEWQCIFGKMFSTCVECDRGSLLHFRIGDSAFVVFKCTTEGATS